MGCDIHAYIECKIKGVWVYMIHPCIWRNYNLFAYLGNVRNDGSIEPMTDNRGLPSDVSQVVNQMSDRWGADAHSHSYMTLDELYELPKQKSKVPLKFMRKLAKLNYVEDVRLVFWFDN